MEAVQIGPLRVRSLGRGDAGGPAIVLCHGFGAPGDDLVALARLIDAGPGVRWFFPEAPLEIDVGSGMAGRAWWEIDLDRMNTMISRGRRDALADETPLGLAEARAQLEATLLELYAHHGVDRSRLVIGGFSQGAMLTTEVALFAESPFAGLAALSGTLLSRERWHAASRASGPKLDVLLTHGRADPLLPFEGAEALKALLEEAGARVDWVPHGGRREIPAVAVDRFGRFAASRFDAAR